MLSPLLFIAVLDIISRKTVMKDATKKLLYEDHLALVANGKQELQETLEEWNGSAGDLDRDTGEEQTTVGRTRRRMADDRI